jgi:hypothetical protein
MRISMPRELTPKSVPIVDCTHELIQDGDEIYCVLCHQSGLDGHPDLVIDKKAEKQRTRQWDAIADGLAGGVGQVPSS